MCFCWFLQKPLVLLRFMKVFGPTDQRTNENQQLQPGPLPPPPGEAEVRKPSKTYVKQMVSEKNNKNTLVFVGFRWSVSLLVTPKAESEWFLFDRLVEMRKLLWGSPGQVLIELNSILIQNERELLSSVHSSFSWIRIKFWTKIKGDCSETAERRFWSISDHALLENERILLWSNPD